MNSPDSAAPVDELRSPIAARDVLVLLLAAVSGYVDAISYLRLGQVFTSNMTGNTVLLGIALGQAQWLAALRAGCALAGYLCGVAAGSVVVARSPRHAIWPARVTAALALECAVLVVFAVGGAFTRAASETWLLYPLIACSAIAMGIQSSAVRALGVASVTTTYITGTWTTLITGVVGRLRAIHKPRQQDEQRTSSLALQAAVVSVYLLLAVIGSVLEARLRRSAMALPAIALALIVVIAFSRFRHTPAEQDQEPGSAA